MTQKDKELLLKDLCARLPYGVKMTDGVDTYRLTSPFLYKYIEMELKPYLRPRSEIAKLISAKEFTQLSGIDLIDWYNANHIDYRGLIPMGLALEALEGMYETEKQKD